jgi:hypothetical protein
MDGKLFDREKRLAMLEHPKANPSPDSIFGAIFQELKNQAKNEKQKKIVQRCRGARFTSGSKGS